jgi:hypothetical protein
MKSPTESSTKKFDLTFSDARKEVIDRMALTTKVVKVPARLRFKK